MTARRLMRLARMERHELAWRMRAAGRTLRDRAGASVSRPRWDRRRLAEAIAPLPELQGVRDALASESWDAAHAAIVDHLALMPARFPIVPARRRDVAARIARRFPRSAGEAALAANRILGGHYDLLGYEALRFGPAGGEVDWHLDPVHQRRAPFRFWTDVPYLDPSSGDHKIIWELNRHQHWLALGRAWWLTGDLRCRARVIAELGGWLPANPPLMGINWASMLELAFRSISWTWALFFFADAGARDERPWSVDLLAGLDRQLTHIEENLSYYFSPNTHLMGEALALYVVSRALPIFRASARRESLGRRILVAEIGRQIEADGGHCERSTHYQRYALDFYLFALTMARLGDDRAAAGAFEEAVDRLARATRLLADHRGRLPHFGDDDGGMAFPIERREPDDVAGSLAAASVLLDRPELRVGPIPEETHWLLAHPCFDRLIDAAAPAVPEPPRSGALERTGYFVSRSADRHHLVIDGGPHGYGNCGHAHADALSLTLTLGGMPFLIDPGTGSYTSDPALRDRLRSSRFHNTLTLDERSQSTPDGPFHWARAASTTVRRWKRGGPFDYFEGSHDGYAPLEHHRHVLMKSADLLVVADRVSGPGTHRADVHWHVGPAWRTRVSGPRAAFTPASPSAAWAELAVPHGLIERFVADEATGLGWHAPVYGRLEPASTVRVSVTARAPFWVVSVFGLDPANAIHAVAAASPAGDGAAIDVRIERGASVDRLRFGGSTDGVSFSRDARVRSRKVAG